MEMVEKLIQILKPEIETFGAELIDCELHGKPGSYRLSVFVDTDDGISIDRCTEISRRLIGLEVLDNLLGERYLLEVSSPGVERPLKTEREFKRKIGKELEILYVESAKNRKLQGKLLAVTGEEILLQTADGEIRIQNGQIKRAVQTLPW